MFKLSSFRTKNLFSLLFIFLALNSFSQEKDFFQSSNFSAFKFRSIGPAYASGRIADIEVNPNNSLQYYLAVAAGNVWKTENAGITFSPIFDNYGSYSIGDVAIDPNNTNVVWVGTGEFNSQRAIGYGDGIYLSVDGGKSFENKGLKNSEHIGRIIIDPRNSDVYVAAQGPLWGAGGDRGLYKSTDKGTTWTKILNVSENTGITDIVFDKRNPDILYAASYQRRRGVFTLIDGGPESAIYKSEDAGKTWRKLKSGLPSVDMGRIGLSISPVNPDYVYAIIEAAEDGGGFFRSTDRGESWTKMSSYVSTSPQYYNRIFCDPTNPDKIFSVDTYSKFSIDGGKTWTNLGLTERHVDDHALWINPQNTNHLIIGGDGGIYETFDHGDNWRHAPNLPVTQYYRVAVDNSKPFYNVAGGTQDNNSMTGPSQTIMKNGIINEDWENTVGGDGFFSAFDPINPDIVYSESQYGGLVRYDKKSRQTLDIQPQPPTGEAYRWNWNAPLIVSSHSSNRLYFAANKLFRSDDRGNSWKVISPDLTRMLDRNKMKVMGIVQSPEAVAKNGSTSLFGNIVSLSESPKNENLIYIGTDDGLIQITENGGQSWRKESAFSGIPEMTYVSCVFASQLDENVVYAAFDARKINDLKPYLLVSKDKGKTWKSISSNLPARGTVYSIAEDYINPNLLFAGTEFGIFFTVDGGLNWVQLKSGLPTIAVHDIKIQKDENDLVIATFGRGIYILDDFSILRNINKNTLEQESILFSVTDAKLFVMVGGKYGQGATYYAGSNPEYGASFYYYLKDGLSSKKDIRKKDEKKNIDEKKDIVYPSQESLRREDDERKPYIVFTVKDENGRIVRRINAPASKGLNKINWGLKYFNMYPVLDENSKTHESQTAGMPAMPGKYTVSMSQVVDNVETIISTEQSFNLIPLNNATLGADDRKSLVAFQLKTAEIYGVAEGLNYFLGELKIRITTLRTALINTPKATSEDIKIADDYLNDYRIIQRALTGDETISSRNENQPPSISDRVSTVVYGIWDVTCDPTETMKKNLSLAEGELRIQILMTKDLVKQVEELEKKAGIYGSPWSKGRIPELK